MQKGKAQQAQAGRQSDRILAGSVVTTTSGETLRWGSYASELPSLEVAARDAVQHILASIGADAAPDLALVFVTSEFGAELDRVVPLLRKLVPSLKHIVGCSGEGVIGSGDGGPSELELKLGFSLSLGQLPGVDIHTIHTLRSSIPEPGNPQDPRSLREWADWAGVPYDTPKDVSFVILADPRFTQVSQILDGLDFAFPDSVKVGGFLSSSSQPRIRALYAWSAAGEEESGGAVGGGVTGEGSRKAGSRGAGSRSRARRVREKPQEMIVLRGGREREGNGSGGGESSAGEEEGAVAQAGQVKEGDGDSVSSSGVGASSSSSSSGISGNSSEGSGGPSERGETSLAQRAGSREGNSGKGSSSSSSNGSSGAGGGGFFGGLFRMLSGQGSSGNGASSSSRAPSSALRWPNPFSSLSPSASSSSSRKGRNARGGARTASKQASSSSSSKAANTEPRGMYLHGAVVLVLHGDVRLETVTSMGYFSPTGRLFKIETVGDALGARIVGVTMDDAVGTGGLPRYLGASALAVREEDDSDDDDSDDEEGFSLTGEVPAISCIIDALDALSEVGEEVMDTMLLAVARDSGKPSSELQPEDFELVKLRGMDENDGSLTVGMDPQAAPLCKGHRFKVMVRNDTSIREGVRESILAYKRKDLQAMMTGRQPAPTFGALLFTDVERGEELYQEPNYEARVLSDYVPTPISGLFAGGQVTKFNDGYRMMENVCVVGMLKATAAAAAPAPASAEQATGDDGDVVVARVLKGAAAAAAAEQGNGSDGGDAAVAMARVVNGAAAAPAPAAALAEQATGEDGNSGDSSVASVVPKPALAGQASVGGDGDDAVTRVLNGVVAATAPVAAAALSEQAAADGSDAVARVLNGVGASAQQGDGSSSGDGVMVASLAPAPSTAGHASGSGAGVAARVAPGGGEQAGEGEAGQAGGNGEGNGAHTGQAGESGQAAASSLGGDAAAAVMVTPLGDALPGGAEGAGGAGGMAGGNA